MPTVDVSETDKAYEITAELPGMDEKNVEVKVANGVLTIKGEKQDEKEEKKKDYHMRERSYGSFERSFQVPDGVDADKIEANFKKGVLTVILPKSAEAKRLKRRSLLNQPNHRTARSRLAAAFGTVVRLIVASAARAGRTAVPSGKVIETTRGDEYGAALARSGQNAASSRTALSGVWLVYGRVRHA